MSNEQDIIELRYCNKCDELKQVEGFYKHCQEPNGIRLQCKECMTIEARKYQNTLNGAITRLTSGAKFRSRKRKGRAAEYAIVKADVLAIWERQEKLCFYSALPMNYDKAEWRISLERLDPSIGYTTKNTVLCCREFNSRSQWSLKKIREMLDILSKNITENFRDFAVSVRAQKKKEPITKTVIEGIENCICNHCHQYKPMAEFRKNYRLGCIQCLSKREKVRYDIPINYLRRLLSNSKLNISTRSDKYERDKTHTLTLSMLTEKFNQQKGLCAVSGIPMQFGSYMENSWTVSLERINTRLGYTDENTCLICLEFNSTNNDVMKCKKGEEIIDDGEGNAGWTSKKFKIFVNNILTNPASKFFGEYMLIR